MKDKKVVLIGPSYPFTTGLTYYVTLLYGQLKKENTVHYISYTMQYPKLLFKREQIDCEDDIAKVDGVEYLLHSANPINWIKVANYIHKLKPDYILFQWLHPYFAPCYYFLIEMLHKYRIIYICHNIFPHERFIFDRFLTKSALKNANYFVVHSESDGKCLESILTTPKYQVTTHPTYNFFKITNINKSTARDLLGLHENEKILLFFGMIRDYKGLKHLLKAMKTIRNEIKEIKLIIAGEFGDDKDSYMSIIDSENINDILQIHSGHIPTREVEKFFAACDLVVLPYESATQSGVIQVAYAFEKPVVATRVGGLPDVVHNGKTGYLIAPFSPEEISDAVIDFFTNEKSNEFNAQIKNEAYKYSWERMEEVITNLIESDNGGKNDYQ